MTAYYNEFDPFAAAWLRSLISAGAIPPGEVDERSIADVQPTDLAGFQQCHFFAGISGWPLALRIAEWPDDRPVWTGSCPCQPFSSAGKRGGQSDERHLWPEFFRLIQACRPPIIFGEQVASAEVVGKAGGRSRKTDQRAWLDGIFNDLEGARYTCGAADLPAACVGAPHIRQRLYWVADAGRERDERRGITGVISGPAEDPEGETRQRERCRDADCDCSATHGLADLQTGRRREVDTNDRGSLEGSGAEGSERPEHCGGAGGLADSDGQRFSRGPESHGIEEQHGEPASRRGDVGGCGGSGSGGDAFDSRLERHARDGGDGSQPGRIDTDAMRSTPEAGGAVSPWSDFDIIHCRDGKARRVGRGVFPLVDGIPSKRSDPRLGWLLAELGRLGHSPAAARAVLRRARANRTGRLKGLGNAIVPQVAAEFVRAWMEITEVLQ